MIIDNIIFVQSHSCIWFSSLYVIIPCIRRNHATMVCRVSVRISLVSRYILLCDMVNVSPRLGGAYRLYLQGRREGKQKKNEHKSYSNQSRVSLRGVIYQKMYLFAKRFSLTGRHQVYKVGFWEVRSAFPFGVLYASSCQSQWPHGLGHAWTSPTRMLGSWVRIRLEDGRLCV
jgi:hypothetical protein